MRHGKAKLTTAVAATMSVALWSAWPTAFAQHAGASISNPPLSTGFRFAEKSGAQLFASICQGCHMPDGKGATGGGTYPSLAADSNLESGGYPVTVVVNGQRGMPPFGAMLSDDQVAAVVNYVRTHFGNRYTRGVTSEDVRAVRR